MRQNPSVQTLGISTFWGHKNYFTNLLDILSDNNTDIIIFTTQEYRDSVCSEISDASKYTWVTQSKTEFLSKFLSRASNIWNNQVDLLISFPIYGLRKVIEYYTMNFNCIHLQMVYNVNMWLGTNFSFTPWVHHYIDSILRSQLITRFDGIIVEYSPIQKYLEKKLPGIDVVSFAPILYENQVNSNSNFRVTIPGHIEPSRRNYQFLIDTIENNLKGYQNDIAIHLLGSASGPEGEEITNKFDQLSDSGWDIEYYTDWIPVKQFEKILQTTDLVVSPIKKYKHKGSVTERYGRTKGSGSFGDAIRYGKPLALPDHYEVPSETKSFVRSYSGKEDLSNIIKSTLNSGGLSESEVKEVERNFSLESQQHRIYNILNRFFNEKSE